MQSKAVTVSAYLKELPPERRQTIQALRKLIKENLPKGYKEACQYGILAYVVPLSIYPKGYGGNPEVPLSYICLASQKNYLSLYLMNIYADPKADKWFREGFRKAGKKLNMGKSCVRFKSLDELPLEIIGKAVALTPVKKYVSMYEKSRA